MQVSRAHPVAPVPINPDFPRCGKLFSMAWKTHPNFFHGVENPDF
jgi:hypothetical protein